VSDPEVSDRCEVEVSTDMKFAFYLTVFGAQQEIEQVQINANVLNAKVLAPSHGKSNYGKSTWEWNSGYLKAKQPNPIDTIEEFFSKQELLFQKLSSLQNELSLIRITLVGLVESTDSVQGFFMTKDFITLLSQIGAEFEFSPTEVFDFLE
jgi:hypothetical protein